MYQIPLESKGESKFSVDMFTFVLLFTTKYNHYLSIWILDIQDMDENILVAGIVLKPNIDLLIPYLQLKKTIGSLIVVENKVGDYKDSTKLGTEIAMLWYPVGEEVILPT